MEKAIMKKEITLDYLRFKLANIINSIDKAKKENNLSVATVKFNYWRKTYENLQNRLFLGIR